MKAIRTLLGQIIDYAGLFPPAELDMPSVVANYRAYLSSEHAWMLGRLIVPVSRLSEFESASEPFLPRVTETAPWRLSALVGGDPRGDAERILDFNRRHTQNGKGGGAVIDAVEARGKGREAIEEVAKVLALGGDVYVEIPIGVDPGPLVEAIAEHGARAKGRTGGVTVPDDPGLRAQARIWIDYCDDRFLDDYYKAIRSADPDGAAELKQKVEIHLRRQDAAMAKLSPAGPFWLGAKPGLVDPTKGPLCARQLVAVVDLTTQHLGIEQTPQQPLLNRDLDCNGLHPRCAP